MEISVRQRQVQAVMAQSTKFHRNCATEICETWLLPPCECVRDLSLSNLQYPISE